ncbi:MAG: hypothetical protein L0170_12590, partial [Acidobacteria bacterium]|nr:hypothetical protein [Acidobacteriota bacterium]
MIPSGEIPGREGRRPLAEVVAASLAGGGRFAGVSPEEQVASLRRARPEGLITRESPIAISPEEEAAHPVASFAGSAIGTAPLAFVGPAAQVGNLAQTAIGRMVLRAGVNAVEQAPLNALQALNQEDPMLFVRSTAVAAVAGGALEGLTVAFQSRSPEFQEAVSGEIFQGLNPAESVARMQQALSDMESGRATEAVADFLDGAEGVVSRETEVPEARSVRGADEGPVDTSFDFGANVRPEAERPGPRAVEGGREGPPARIAPRLSL